MELHPFHVIPCFPTLYCCTSAAHFQGRCLHICGREVDFPFRTIAHCFNCCDQEQPAVGDGYSLAGEANQVLHRRCLLRNCAFQGVLDWGYWTSLAIWFHRRWRRKSKSNDLEVFDVCTTYSHAKRRSRTAFRQLCIYYAWIPFCTRQFTCWIHLFWSVA